jgi:hypothetical protein
VEPLPVPREDKQDNFKQKYFQKICIQY